MEIEVRFYSRLLRYSPRGERSIKLKVEEGSSVSRVLESLEIPSTAVYVVLVNGKQAEMEHVAADGDQIALVPPVGGG